MLMRFCNSGVDLGIDIHGWSQAWFLGQVPVQFAFSMAIQYGKFP